VAGLDLLPRDVTVLAQLSSSHAEREARRFREAPRAVSDVAAGGDRAHIGGEFVVRPLGGRGPYSFSRRAGAAGSTSAAAAPGIGYRSSSSCGGLCQFRDNCWQC